MNKLSTPQLFLFSILFLSFFKSHAQELEPIAHNERKEILQKLADSLAYFYVNYEMGITLGELLLKNEKQGVYSAIKHPDTLASRLTKDLREASGDLHLYVGHKPKVANAPVRLTEPPTKGRLSNYGLTETQIMENNIGYIKIAHFSNWQNFEGAKEAITSAIQVVENTDAIIFDIRDNPGGVPHLVSYLISYLFEGKRIHLTQYIHRYKNASVDIYTEPNIPGKKLPKTPIFILVNHQTASAGEEFAYWLKHSKRATIIGDTTAGAGYGVLQHRLNNRFVTYISSEEESNPVTGTNFQGVGVIPHISASNDEDALSIALQLAQKEASQMKFNRDEVFERLSKDWATISKDTPSEDILNIIRACNKENIADREAINRMGYHFLNEWNSPEKAEDIFKLNVALHPDSPNVYDSYGEALEANQRLSNAAKNFEIAYRLGVANNSPHINYLKGNFDRLKEFIEVPESDQEKIESVLNDYINGTEISDAFLLKKAFHKDLNLYSISSDQSLNVLNGKQYISYFEDGRPRNRKGKIISFEFDNDIAIAKVEVDLPERKRLYTDYLMLMKIHGQWSIINKSYTYKTYE